MVSTTVNMDHGQYISEQLSRSVQRLTCVTDSKTVNMCRGQYNSEHVSWSVQQ